MDSKKEIQELIHVVVSENASDLHLAEGRYPVLRVSGQLVPLNRKAVFTKENIHGILKEMLLKENYERFIAEKEIDFSFGTKDARFRGNAYFQQGLISIALRLIPKKVRDFSELNLPQSLEIFTEKKSGFFLVVGPIGHGKSTTLAAIIESINIKRAEHIVTVEDPIEHLYEPKKSIIDQREIGIDTASFPTALKNMFREDINVALIGEMREYETISTAVTAAETGHYVLSTLHTNNAPQTIARIIDSFPSDQQNQIRSQLASSLSGIFSQRLIPCISGGLVPAYELLINNGAVANMIRENRLHEINSIIETGLSEGMIDMNRCLVDLVNQGKISLENARMYSPNLKVLDKLL